MKQKKELDYHNLRYRPKDFELNKFQPPDHLKKSKIFYEPQYVKEQVIFNNAQPNGNKQYFNIPQTEKKQYCQQNFKTISFQHKKENIHKQQQHAKQGLSSHRDYYVQQGSNERKYLNKVIETPERIKQLRKKKFEFYQSKYLANHQQLIDTRNQQEKEKYNPQTLSKQKLQQFINIQEKLKDKKDFQFKRENRNVINPQIYWQGQDKIRNLRRTSPIKTYYQPPKVLENYVLSQKKFKQYPSIDKSIDRYDYGFQEYENGRYLSKEYDKLDTRNKRLLKGVQFKQAHKKYNYSYPCRRLISFGGLGNK